MSRDVRRSTTVDFLRGLALIVIAVDHVSQSALSHLTLHTIAFCEAAEVFVFLGGYASAADFYGFRQLDLVKGTHGHSRCRHWCSHRAARPYLILETAIAVFRLIDSRAPASGYALERISTSS
jgi:hypothetical protein